MAYRNTQLILQEETGVTSVVDPFGGSYMMESLTSELANAALDVINEVKSVILYAQYLYLTITHLRSMKWAVWPKLWRQESRR